MIATPEHLSKTALRYALANRLRAAEGRSIPLRLRSPGDRAGKFEPSLAMRLDHGSFLDTASPNRR